MQDSSLSHNRARGTVLLKFKQNFMTGRHLRSGIAIAVLGWSLWPITSSALHGDDIPNSMRSAVLKFTGESRWQHISSAVGQWLQNEGRFFPISAIENVYLFSTVHSVAVYKFVQWMTLICLVLVMTWFVRLLSGSNGVLPVIAFGVVAALQTRNWYDPTFGFGLLLQSVALKVFLSAIFLHYWITGRRCLFWGALSLILWTTALLQYEVVITLLPILGVVALMSSTKRISRRFVVVMPHLVISVIYLVISQLLRDGKAVSPAYATNTDLHTVVPTYARQLSASVPFSAHLWNVTPATVIGATSVVALAIFGSLGVLATKTLSCDAEINSSRDHGIIGLFAIGINLIVGPGLPTSLSLRWQAELSWGLGYLPVFLQYLGVALVIVAVILWLRTRTQLVVVLRCILTLVVALCAISATANRTLLIENVRAQEPARWSREFYEASVRMGFFDQVADGSIIESSVSDPNSWISNYFTLWLGGPNNLTFVKSGEDRKSLCEVENCQNRSVFSLEPLNLTNGRQGLVLRERLVETNGRDTATEFTFFAPARIVLPLGYPAPCGTNKPAVEGRSVSIFDCLDEASVVFEGGMDS